MILVGLVLSGSIRQCAYPAMISRISYLLQTVASTSETIDSVAALSFNDSFR
jgi:hypothetical protein